MGGWVGGWVTLTRLAVPILGAFCRVKEVSTEERPPVGGGWMGVWADGWVEGEREGGLNA